MQSAGVHGRPSGLHLRLAEGPLEIGEALAIALQLCTQLAEQHAQGLLHLAIEPAAVRLDPVQGGAAWRDRGQAWPIADGSRAVVAPALLARAAPELSGRLAGAVDPCSDLYAFGVLLYEMLTGVLPFGGEDDLALLHAHVAAEPMAPSARRAEVPPLLSALVLQLLSKQPEDRYRTATGLAHDLAHAARAWAAHEAIPPFPLRTHDRGGRLPAATRLYGREREVSELVTLFEQVCAGTGPGRIVLVEGWSGIGKTALIQQLDEPIARHRGHFVAGKFDQVMRAVPYGALLEALRALLRRLIGAPEVQLAHWRQAIGAALVPNAGVLADALPELVHLLGPLPAPAALGGVEAQNRFRRVLQLLLAVLARPEHPLVLFLDDLQWADSATLTLLEPLLAAEAVPHLLLIGAFRDHELDAAPALARTIDTLQSSGVALHRLSLGPLSQDDLGQWLTDVFGLSSADAAALATRVHRKTGGNPFFADQFLQLIAREGALRLDPDGQRWTADLPAIDAMPVSDNVVELMTRRLQRLSARTQQALRLAACIGARFDAATLAVVARPDAPPAGVDLTEAVAEGLVVVTAASPAAYAFLHDRVQQAAYGLIPPAQRAAVHLSVGRLLRQRIQSAGTTPSASQLFEIAGHLERGRTLIVSDDERREVAGLDLLAGRRAKASAAFDAALGWFEAGLALVGEADAGADPLAYALRLEAAECRYLCGRLDAAQGEIERLLAQVREPLRRAEVLRLRSVAAENQARYTDAIAGAREGLALLGVVFPDSEAGKQAALERELAQVEALRAGRDIASFAELPEQQDPAVRMAMRMQTDMWASAFIVGDATLARLLSATMVRLSLQHGNAPESAYGYVTHAITVGPVRGDYAAAYAYGRLALAVNERFDDRRLRAKVNQQFHAHVALWCQPLRSCIAHAREAFRAGLDAGDFLYASYGAGTEPWAAFPAAQDLGRFVDEYMPLPAVIARLKEPLINEPVGSD